MAQYTYWKRVAPCARPQFLPTFRCSTVTGAIWAILFLFECDVPPAPLCTENVGTFLVVDALAPLVQVDLFARCHCRSRRAARSCVSAWARDFNPRLHQLVQSFSYIFHSRCRVNPIGMLIQHVAWKGRQCAEIKEDSVTMLSFVPTLAQVSSSVRCVM